MSLRWFGGAATGMAVVNPETGAWLPNDAGSVWDSEAGGTQLVDLVDGNSAPLGATVYSDEYGYCQLFGVDTDPATEVVWVDFTGLGKRVRLECRDRATFRADAQDLDGLATQLEVSQAADAARAGAVQDVADTKGQPGGIATLDTSGLLPELQVPTRLTQAELDLAYGGTADTSALETRMDGLEAQQNQLMSTAATTEELVTTIQVSAVPDGAGGTTLTTSSLIITGLVAPFPVKILSCSYTREYVDVAASGTNWFRVQLQRADANGALVATMASKSTTEEALTARKPWLFDGVVWNETHRVLQTNEVLRINMDRGGTTDVRCPMHFTVRYAPL